MQNSKKCILALIMTVATSLYLARSGDISAQTPLEQQNDSGRQTQLEAQIAVQEGAPIEVTISPPVAYIQVKPGSSIAHTITLTNNGSSQLQVKPVIVDFATDGQTGKPVLKQAHSFPYFADEAELNKEIVLLPDQKAQLTMSITVPSDAADKEYPLSILFQSTAVNSPAENPELIGTIASNLIVLVSKSGLPPNDLAVTDIAVTNLVDSFSELRFTPIAENRAFSASQASGSATITDWRGKVVAEYTVFPDNILGFSQRELRFLAERIVLADGTSTQTLENQPQEFVYDAPFLLGPYKITIELQNQTPGNPGSDSTAIQTASYSEVVFAFPLAVGVLIVVLSLVIGLYVWQKRRIPKLI